MEYIIQQLCYFWCDHIFLAVGRGHLQLHFQKCSSWKCRSQKCKNKNKSSEALGWSKKSFVWRFENDTFESIFFNSVEIESVVVSVHPLSIIFFRLDQKEFFGLTLAVSTIAFNILLFILMILLTSIILCKVNDMRTLSRWLSHEIWKAYNLAI